MKHDSRCMSIGALVKGDPRANASLLPLYLCCSLTAGTHLPYSMQQVNTQLVNLSARLQHCLRGLSLTGFCWSKSTVDHLAVITGLTSLQLLQVCCEVWCSTASLVFACQVAGQALLCMVLKACGMGRQQQAPHLHCRLTLCRSC